MEDYKGLFYNEDNTKQYYEGGAHFSYISLVHALNIIKKEQEEIKREKENENIKLKSINNSQDNQVRNDYMNTIIKSYGDKISDSDIKILQKKMKINMKQFNIHNKDHLKNIFLRNNPHPKSLKKIFKTEDKINIKKLSGLKINKLESFPKIITNTNRNSIELAKNFPTDKIHELEFLKYIDNQNDEKFPKLLNEDINGSVKKRRISKLKLSKKDLKNFINNIKIFDENNEYKNKIFISNNKSHRHSKKSFQY